jgi:hypothetical protein
VPSTGCSLSREESPPGIGGRRVPRVPPTGSLALWVRSGRGSQIHRRLRCALSIPLRGPVGATRSASLGQLRELQNGELSAIPKVPISGPLDETAAAIEGLPGASEHFVDQGAAGGGHLLAGQARLKHFALQCWAGKLALSPYDTAGGLAAARGHFGGSSWGAERQRQGSGGCSRQHGSKAEATHMALAIEPRRQG